jgi:hypothetical protein
VEQAADEVDQLERSKGDQSQGEAAGCVELGDSDDSTGGCFKAAGSAQLDGAARNLRGGGRRSERGVS